MAKPPPLVELVLCGVMTALKRPPTWEECKKQLGDANFLMKLTEFDKDQINDALIKKLNKYTSQAEFMPDVIAKVSRGLGEAMVGINIDTLPAEQRYADRGW